MLLSAKYIIKYNDSTISPIVQATKIQAIIACQLLITFTRGQKLTLNSLYYFCIYSMG